MRRLLVARLLHVTELNENGCIWMHTDAYAYWYGVVWIIYCWVVNSSTLWILFELVPVYGVSKKWSSLILFFFGFVHCRTLLCLSLSMSSNSHKFYMSSSVNYSQRAEGNTCLASPCWFWRSCRNRASSREVYSFGSSWLVNSTSSGDLFSWGAT